MRISRVFFLFFNFIKIVIFWVVRWIKGQKNGLKWEKIHSVTVHISGTIHHMIFIYAFMVYTNDNISRIFFFFFLFFSVRWWYLQAFFQIFDFSEKKQKTVQNEKRFCQLNSISQEPYITWLSFVVENVKW